MQNSCFPEHLWKTLFLRIFVKQIDGNLPFMYRYTYVPHTHNDNAKNGGPEELAWKNYTFGAKRCIPNKAYKILYFKMDSA